MRSQLMVIVVRLRLCWQVTLINPVLQATTSVCPNVVTLRFVLISNHAASVLALSPPKPSVNRVLALTPQTAFVSLRTVVLKLCTVLVQESNFTTDIMERAGLRAGPFFCLLLTGPSKAEQAARIR